MTFEILFLLVLLGITLAAFIREIFPIEVTALGLLGVLVVTGLVTPEQALEGFSNKAVIAIGGLFVLGHALVKTGLLELAADYLSQRTRRRAWLGMGALLALAALLSGFLNNTAVVAMFIPLMMNVCSRLEVSPSRVLIPLSYVSIAGGTLTLIGTSTNLLVSAIAEEAGEPPFLMFEFTKLGGIFLVVGLLYILLFAPRLLPERAQVGPLTQKYRMGPYLTEVQLVEDSKLVGATLREMKVSETYDVTVLAVLREEERLTETIGTIPLREGDTLILRGPMDNILRLRSDLGVALLPEIKLSDEELAAGGQITAEALITPTSRLIGRTLKEIDFHRQFGGFVLAIRRLGETFREKIADVPLRFSDTLLMTIPRERLTELRRSEDLIILSEVTLELHRERFWWLGLALLPAIVLVAALGILDITTGALLGAIILLLSGAVPPQEAYRAVDWSVLFLIAAFVPVGEAVVQTGTAELIATGLQSVAGFFPQEMAPYVLVALVYLISSLTTQIVSNNAAAIILTPIAISLAVGLGVNSRPFLMAVCFAASAGFMTPMSYQTNMMVYGPGNYRFLDYTRFGTPLNLLFWLLAALLIPAFWPF